MITRNKSSIVMLVISIILLYIVFYSEGFEELLSLLLSRKTNTISRTPLYIYFFQHLQMVIISSFIAIIVGVSLGIFITTEKGEEYKDIFLKLVNIGQAFPSPALLALMVPVLGYGLRGALIALVLYAFMPIIYNTVIGIEQVSVDVVEAAKGMGMNNYMIYKKIKIPLATKVILGGIRTATIINISAATLAAAVGAGGLGVPVVNGVRTFDMILILQGAIPVTLLAIITELALKKLELRFD